MVRQDAKQRHLRAEKMEHAELLAVEADGLYLLNGYKPPSSTGTRSGLDRHRRVCGQETSTNKPDDMVTHTLEQFGMDVVDDEKPTASTRFSSNKRLDFFLGSCRQEFGRSRRKDETLSDHMIAEVRWKNGKQTSNQRTRWSQGRHGRTQGHFFRVNG